MSFVEYRVQGRVAVLVMDAPPLNGFSLQLRKDLVAALDRAYADPAVDAIVLTGNAQGFSAGGDIGEFGTDAAAAEPNLRTVIRILDRSRKPTVAAISGICLGGGLEVALACHYRVGLPDAQVGMPEVKIGLLPGAGGTQRLPRVVGVESALNMIVSGAPVRAETLKETVLFDLLVDEDVLAAGVALAEKASRESLPLKRVRDIRIDYPQHEAFFQFARNTVKAASRHFPAPLRCVDAVAAAVTRPFEAGLDIELRAFLDLLDSSESRAQRHAFFAERAAVKVSDVPEDTPIRPLASIAVIGAGTMGTGIAMCFADAGFPVSLVEARADVLDRGIAAIRKHYESAVRKGRLAAQELDRRMGLIEATVDLADVAQADLVIEAVFEDLGVKKEVFQRLDEVAKAGAILATNTSTLDVDVIAAFTKRPQDVIGMHFFSPANVMRLLEVVRGAQTSKEVLATVLAVARKIRKTSVVSGVCFGFIGNRMIDQYYLQVMALLEEGVLPRQIDGALEKWGMAMGPLRMADMAGNDIGWLIRQHRFADHPERRLAWTLADRLCEAGRFGQKAGKGWYRYEPGSREALPDGEVEQMILHRREELGLPQRKVSSEEIVQRCILALANEGARILEEGIAQRASDIDLVFLTGYGFPLHRGGPMFWAESTVGLYEVVRLMGEFAANSPCPERGAWTPAPLIGRLADEGKRFPR